MEDSDVKRKNTEQGRSNADSPTNRQHVRDDVKAAGTGSGESYVRAYLKPAIMRWA